MSATIEVLLTEPIATINPNVYGHFAEHLGRCIDEGFWVGEDSAIPNDRGVRLDTIAALREVGVPVLRWPGGCFADDYHWQDGIGPREQRPRRVNLWWPKEEDNQFGTDEYLHTCRLLGAEPYIAVNLGSGTVNEALAWMQYCNDAGTSEWARRRAANGHPAPYNVRWWGIGNENWGCGGHFTPEEYAGAYRRFATYLRGYADTPPFLIACGPNGNDLDWTERFFTGLAAVPTRRQLVYGYGAHYYTDNRDERAGTATEYTEEQWYLLLWRAQAMETLVVQQRALLDRFDPERRIGLIVDEWGTWHPPTPGRHPRFLWQQNTLRDALVAALTLDIFNRHAEKLVMANIAQTVNVLQALLLTQGDQVVRTPTYHVFDLYLAHQGARAVRLVVDSPEVTFPRDGEPERLVGLAGSASLRDDRLTLTVVNPRIAEPVEATITLRGDATANSAGEVEETVLTHADIHAHNTFAAPDTVALAAPRSLPADGRVFRHRFAPQSVTRLVFALA